MTHLVLTVSVILVTSGTVEVLTAERSFRGEDKSNSLLLRRLARVLAHLTQVFLINQQPSLKLRFYFHLCWRDVIPKRKGLMRS